MSEPISTEVRRLSELTTLEMPEASPAVLSLLEEDLVRVTWREKTLSEKLSEANEVIRRPGAWKVLGPGGG